MYDAVDLSSRMLLYTGHESAQAYLQTGAQNVRDAMKNVKVPLLCFLAEDDPLVQAGAPSMRLGRQHLGWQIWLLPAQD